MIPRHFSLYLPEIGLEKLWCVHEYCAEGHIYLRLVGKSSGVYMNIVLKVHIYLRLVGKSSGVYMNIELKVHIHLRLVGKSSGVYMNIELKVHILPEIGREKLWCVHEY